MLYKLRMERQKHKKTQQDMANLLHISRSSYSDKEVGRQHFRHDEMVIIAREFNVTLNDIFWEDEELDKEIYVWF